MITKACPTVGTKRRPLLGTLGLVLSVGALVGQTSTAAHAQDAEQQPASSPEPIAEPASSPADTKLPEPPPEPRAATVSITAVEPPPPAAPTSDLAITSTPVAEAEGVEPSEGYVKISGYAEAYYSRNFRRPQNGITNDRWLDEKDNTFTLQTVVLDMDAARGPFSAKLTLMFGPTADRWYFEGVRPSDDETDVLLSPAGYNNETWKHIQNAFVGYKAPIGEGLLIQGGLFPTQVGFEGTAVKDNWNWSRSNTFNFLPFFHLGARVSYPLTEKLTATAAVYNGWNQATDLNSNKSASFQLSYVGEKGFINGLYIGGVERPRNDGTGEPWRNLFDVVGQYDVNDVLSLATDVNAGFEKSNIGDHKWFAASLYARVKALEWLYFAGRGDGIFEFNPGVNPSKAENSILILGADHIVSATGTVEFRPVGDGFSLRLEYRHDHSDPDAKQFYKRGYYADGSQKMTSQQDTFTIGVTGWF